MSHKKFGPDRFSRFDVYWIQTNKQTNRQTDRQAKFIYRYWLQSNYSQLNQLQSIQSQSVTFAICYDCKQNQLHSISVAISTNLIVT